MINAVESFTAHCYPLDDLAKLSEHWQLLETKADNPVFLSWQWIGVWLGCYQLPVQVLEVRNAEQALVGLGLLLEHRIRRYGVLSSRCLRLHQSGRADLDQIWIEYNGFLTAKLHSTEIEDCALNFVKTQLQWDEWIIGAIELPKAQRYAAQLQVQSHVLWEAPCYGVDLYSLRQQQQAYSDSLSANTRYQINRSLKLYQQRGEVKLVRPQSLAEALEWFEFTGPLHLKRWGAGPHCSGFANPEFVRFHRQMLQSCWPNGADIVALTVAGQTIATFYNFIYRNRVYFYLGGLDIEADNKLKPGLLGHMLCIEDYLARGFDYYDFMGGEERYKTQLGSLHTHLVQVSMQRKQFKFLLEQQARKVKRQLFGEEDRIINKSKRSRA
ncbi:GNAT family N-acetyltransferase [Alishewanella sp. HL-SH06]|uniref:GNAT family N-acetyltransferase n=1 Tax=Alishewanella sp. HL-SH06 TaxID=3461144 RepID=UPI0040419048